MTDIVPVGTLEERLSHLRLVSFTRHETYMNRCWIENDADGFTGWRWDKYNVQLRIVAAANKYGTFIVQGSRHFCVSMNAMIDLIGLDALHAYAGGPENEVQGFIDQFGTFHDRFKAAEIAIAAGQVKAENIRANRLFSEEVW